VIRRLKSFLSNVIIIITRIKKIENLMKKRMPKRIRIKRKLQEMILYIAQQSEDNPDFGTTLLNKVLFYADFYAFGETGKSISGVTYVRLPHGPAPERMSDVKRKLEKTGIIYEEEETHTIDPDKYVKRVTARREPDLSRFSDAEIELLDKSIDFFRGLTAKEAGEWSHKFMGWRLTDNGDEIPYEAWLWGMAGEIHSTEKAIQYGKELLEQLNSE
jgi:hypothetical protein